MLLAEYASSNYDTDITLTHTGANQQLAQGFRVSRDCVVGRIYVYLTLTGSPDGYVYLEIQSDDGGIPNKTALTSGASEYKRCTSISDGMNYFDWPLDERPELEAKHKYHVVLKSSGYTQDSSNLVAMGGDQSSPHYNNGAGSTYDGTDWTAIGTATDFTFQIYSGHSITTYSNIREVEALTRHLTTSGKFTNSPSAGKPTAADVMDFEDTTSQMIDGWLAAAGITPPLTATTSKAMVKQGANYCVVLNVEMTQVSAGFKTENSDTRAGAARTMCMQLQKQIMDGALKDALKQEEGGADVSGVDALTAGQIDSDERDSRVDNDDIVQPIFSTGMFNNP